MLWRENHFWKQQWMKPMLEKKFTVGERDTQWEYVQRITENIDIGATSVRDKIHKTDSCCYKRRDTIKKVTDIEDVHLHLKLTTTHKRLNYLKD